LSNCIEALENYATMALLDWSIANCILLLLLSEYPAVQYRRMQVVAHSTDLAIRLPIPALSAMLALRDRRGELSNFRLQYP
jgi:hypothetical protein